MSLYIYLCGSKLVAMVYGIYVNSMIIGVLALV